MGKLEDLVPPLDLCKQIPEGEFADSALVWNTTVCDEEDGEICGVHERDDCESWMRENQIPAPTLAEIVDKLGNISLWRADDTWEVSLKTDPENWLGRHSDNPADSALRLWLEVKGADHERAAAERAAAERIELSPREREIQRMIGR